MKTVKVKGPACPATSRISKWGLGHSHGFSLEFMRDCLDKYYDETFHQVSSMQLWELLGQFLVWNLRWLRDKRCEEVRGASECTHTHSLTHGQAGNTRHIWAGCCPAPWLVSSHQSWPLIGCRLRCVTSVLLCIPWHWHQIQSPSSFTQPIPGCRPGQQVAETPETGFCYQLYSGLLTAVSALIVVTGLQTVIDWILDAPRKHSVQWSASWAASDPGPIVSVS